MKIDDLLEEFEKDSKIGPDLIEEVHKIPRLHNKYYKRLTKIRQEIYKTSEDYKALEFIRQMYYMGRASGEAYRDEKPFEHRIVKSELPVYISVDKKLKPLRDKLESLKQFEEALTEIVKQINNRNFLIGSINATRNFEAGNN